MAKHRPAHARSGLGRYTPPRRIHPAHAMLSAKSSGLGRLAGGVLGGSAIATAGFLALAGMPAGASPAVSVQVQTPGPLIAFTLSPSFFGHNVATTTLSSGGAPALAIAAAGSFTPFNHSDHNTAEANVTGPFGAAIALAGVGIHEGSSDNTAIATQQGFGISLSAAGVGEDAGDSDNVAGSLSFDGIAVSLAGDGSDAGDSDNTAGSVAFGGAVSAGGVVAFAPAIAIAVAGVGDEAGHADNLALAAATDAGSAIALAGNGDHSHSSGNTAIATSSLASFLFPAPPGFPPGGAFAISGEGDDNTAIAGAAGEQLAPYSSSIAVAGRGSDNTAVAGSLLGVADATAGEGSGNTAAAQADAGGLAIATADHGDDNSAYAGAIGGASADADATTAGSTANSASVVGGTSFADANTVWSVSLNGGTVIS
jgi:hypothetical protein